MKRICLLVGLLLAGAFPLSALATSDIRVAVIKNVNPPVSVLRKGTPLEQIQEGTVLLKGDEIRTSADGSLGLAFEDGTRVSLGPQSTFSVSEYLFQPASRQFSFKMYMQKGSMVYASGKLGKLAPESVRIATPQGTIGIRGTKLLIQVD